MCRRGYSRAYLHHLVRQREMGAAVLLSQHNVFFLLDLMRRARAAVLAGEYARFEADWLASEACEDY